MPRLLRDVLCVIDTFHKYAREDGDGATLTCRELKRLVQGEFGDTLQPCVVHAVERNLNLLDVDSDGTISFDEFVLAIFNLLNLYYLDIQSLLNSEPGQVSKPEEKPDGVDLQAASRTGPWTEGTPPPRDKAVLPSGTGSAAQLSPEERGCSRAGPRGDAMTHKLPGDASGHSDPKNQHVEGDEQSQEVTQDVPATRDEGAQIETNKPKAESEQTGSPTKGEGQDEEIPRDGDEPAREQSGAETRDQLGEQEGNLGTQSSPAEETTQTPPDGQEAAAGRGARERSKTPEQPPQGKDKPSSERAEPPAQTATWKPVQTQKSAAPEDGGGTAKTREPGKDADRTAPETKNSAEAEDDGGPSESREPPAQGKECETKDELVQGDSRNVSETPRARTEKKEGRGPKAHEPVGQEGSERKTQAPALGDQAQDGTYQALRESSKERDAEEGSKTQELSSEGRDQNRPEIEGAVSPGEEARGAEEGTAEAPASSQKAPAAEGTPGAGEGTWELSPPENQSGGENKRVTTTRDKPVKGDEGNPEAPVTQSDKGSAETPSSLTAEDGDISSETSDLPVQGDSQSQADPLGASVQGRRNNDTDTQRGVALGEKNRTREAGALAVGAEEKPVTGEPPDREGRESQGPAVEPNGHPGAQASTAGGGNGTSPETETPAAPNADLTGQLAVRQLPGKEGSKGELKAQGPGTREQGERVAETQEAPVKRLNEANSAPLKAHFQTEEAATLEEEEERPQELAGEGDDEQEPAMKGHDSPVPQPGPEERTQRDPEPRSADRGTASSSPLYSYLQEKLLQPTGRAEDERQAQVQSARPSSPELPDDQLTAEIADCPVLFRDSEALRQSTRELLPNGGPADAQQTSAPRAWEDTQGHPQRDDPEAQRDVSATMQ